MQYKSPIDQILAADSLCLHFLCAVLVNTSLEPMQLLTMLTRGRGTTFFKHTNIGCGFLVKVQKIFCKIHFIFFITAIITGLSQFVCIQDANCSEIERTKCLKNLHSEEYCQNQSNFDLINDMCLKRNTLIKKQL